MNIKSLAVILAIATFVGLAGCTPVQEKHESNQLAATAARTPYPSTMQAKQSDRVGAIIDRAGNSIDLANFGNIQIHDADVWINNAFVYHIDTLPSNGYLRLNLGSFYDQSGNAFGTHNVRVNSVQIAAKDTLWTLMGPINH